MVDWRFFSGKHAFYGYCFLGLGGLISCVNFYLSFLRYPLHRLLGGKKEDYRWISGFPLFGTLTIVGLPFLPRSIWLSFLALVFLLIDTAGIPWFIIAVWKDDSFWRGDPSKADGQHSEEPLK
jgi:hypothetical protein